MYTTYINQTSVGAVSSLTTPGGVSETNLEQTVGVSLIADFNTQLNEMAEAMQDQLDAKNELSEEIALLQSYSSRETVTTSSGEEAVEVTTEEYQALIDAGYTDLTFEQKADGSGYYLVTEGLTGTISAKQEELAGLNSNSELMMLQIQSLIDQRKNAITLMSNLLSSRNEVLMNIIRNLKN